MDCAPARPDGIEPDALVRALADHLRHWLPTQRWFSAVGEVPDAVIPLALDVLVEGWPTLVWCPVEVTHQNGRTERYQLVLTMHRMPAVGVEPTSLIGVVAAPAGSAHVYDAMGDPVGAMAFARHFAPELKLETPDILRSRSTSTSSVSFDERWLLTLYRRIEDGPQPDVEISVALGGNQVPSVVRPAAVWRSHGWDVASIRALLPRSVDGVELARRSLAEMFSHRASPSEIHADLRSDALDLGAALGEFHVGMANVFGTQPVDADALVDSLVETARAAATTEVDLKRLEATLGRLRQADDLGSAIRIHGDLHLGNVMHDRKRWVLVNFGGNPQVPLDDRVARRSPLRDIASLLHNLRVLARAELTERLVKADESYDQELDLLAEAWEERVSTAVVAGYASVHGVHELLPQDRASRDALLAVFELDHLVVDFARSQLAAR